MNIKLLSIDKRFLLLTALFLFGVVVNAQYTTTHYIAPAPWQYWSDANEIVISTLENQDVEVLLYRSDGPLITSLTINGGDYARSYRFVGNPTVLTANSIGVTFANRGLIVEASAPVLVNMRNIASDTPGTNAGNIKGNASLVSLGDEGLGTLFRLGYYRSSFGGINAGSPLYSVMAVYDNTSINIDGVGLAILNAGESRVFNAPIGALLEASQQVVVNVGSYGDTPAGCGGNGEDGTFTQIPPINVLGNQYMVVRGNGVINSTADAPEQTTFISSEDNTTVQVISYDALGVQVGTANTYTLNDAGDYQSIHHGDGQNQFSTSLITSDKPIVVYAGTAVNCETDISTVLPIGNCAGINEIRTLKFVSYNGTDLPYFCSIIIEDDTAPVFINGDDIEVLTGNSRLPIGNSGFYLITFENTDFSNTNPLLIESQAKLTTSIVQQGEGFSMSGYFSAFKDARLNPPVVDVQDCQVILIAEFGADPYQWYLDGELIVGATGQTYIPVVTGNYSVSGTFPCGETFASQEVEVLQLGVTQIVLDLGEDLAFCELPISQDIDATPINIGSIPETLTYTWYRNGDLLPETSAIITAVLPGTYSVEVSYEDYGCSETDEIIISAVDFEVFIEDDEVELCDVFNYTIVAEIQTDGVIDINEVSFLWSTGQTTQEITVTETGLYWVEATYQGCSEVTDVFVTFTQPVDITLGENIQKCPDEEVILAFTNGGDIQNAHILWFYHGQLIAEGTTEITVTEFGVYLLEVDVDGCVSQAEIEILPYNNNQNCVITQGISPEGSLGQNDNFDLTFLANRTGIEELRVFNRYGTLVYKKQNYVDEWSGQTSSGEILPTGLYYYHLIFSAQDKKYGSEITGWIYINRNKI